MPQLHKHIHSRILIQIVIIIIAALFLGVAVVHDAIAGDVSFMTMAVATVVGLAVGYLSGRMFLMTWHEDTQKVIVRMDKMSFVLIGVYVLFRIFSTQLLGDYFTGAALSAISFSAIDGILIGRFVSMWRNINRIFREQGIVGTRNTNL